jgi:DNA mismatch repair protein MutS2
VDTLLIDLEREKKEIFDTKQKLERQQKRVDTLLAENEELKNFLDENRKSLLKEAKQEAKNIILNANKLVENTIAEIKSSNADKEVTKNLRDNLTVELQKNTVKAETPKPRTAVDEEIKPGDWVKLIDGDTTGQVIELIKDNVVIAMGELRTVVKRKRVEKVAKSAVPKEMRRSSNTHTSDIANFSPEIDVRGMRTEDALFAIEKLFDRALMMGFGTLKVLHGKGDGILRKMIRQYLKKYDQVDRMEDEHPDRGGDGITYVYLK